MVKFYADLKEESLLKNHLKKVWPSKNCIESPEVGVYPGGGGGGLLDQWLGV